MTKSAAITCAHCGLPVPGHGTAAEIRGQQHTFCCTGCAFVYGLVGGGESGGSSASWFLILLGFGVVLSGFIMSFSFAIYFNPDLPTNIRNVLQYIMLALATPVIFGIGYSYLRTAAREIVLGRLSMSSLIAIGTVSAYGYSAYLTLHHAPHVYFDSASMVIVLVTVGRFLQARARARASEAMRAHVAQAPRQARRVRDGADELIPVEAISTGDLIRVLPGEMMAVDGRIREGRTTVDESRLTGESLPVPRVSGDMVFQGTVNLDGSVAVEALQTGEGTLQAQIERLLADAAAARMPLQALVDRVSSVFVAAILTLAAGVFLYYETHDQPAGGLLNALAVLVVACPCALGLATPMAAFVALQRGAREGVLIRSTEVLEKLAHVDTVVFDKTGTLTEGKLTVEVIRAGSDSGISNEKLLEIAASLESCSEHHLGRSIVEQSRKCGTRLWPVTGFRNRPGEGIEGSLAWSDDRDAESFRVYLGTIESLSSRGLELPADLGPAAAGAGFGTVVYIGWAGQVRGLVRLGDHLRPAAGEAVEECRRQRLDVHMLSGDRLESVQQVAAALGISNWASGQLPTQKLEYVKQLQRKGRRVAMVGDGINDAPALAQAHVGFTHQVATDLSREAADIHVLGGDLARVPWSVSLARKTFRHIRQNLFWAFFYNVIAMSMAAVGWLTPIVAAVAMVASSLMVAGNSLRLAKLPGAPGAVLPRTGSAQPLPEYPKLRAEPVSTPGAD